MRPEGKRKGRGKEEDEAALLVTEDKARRRIRLGRFVSLMGPIGKRVMVQTAWPPVLRLQHFLFWSNRQRVLYSP